MARSRARRATKPIEQSSLTKMLGIGERSIFHRLTDLNAWKLRQPQAWPMIARQFLDKPVAMVVFLGMFLHFESAMTTALGQTAIRMTDLPAPPAELEQLIEAGKVTFQYGTSDGETPFDDIITEKDTAAIGQPGTRLAAATQYRIRFDYDAKFTWRILESQRELRISLQLRRFGWQPSHTVWFRDRPEIENFWTSPLVLHEFDHIRLSTDPRMKARFEELVRTPVVIRHRLGNNETADHQLARRLTDEHLQRMQQEVLELIEIRYQELDRVTSHGRDALGQDSPLYEWLRNDRSTTDKR